MMYRNVQSAAFLVINNGGYLEFVLGSANLESEEILRPEKLTKIFINMDLYSVLHKYSQHVQCLVKITFGCSNTF